MEVDHLVESERFAEALGMLDRLCREYPDDEDLAERRAVVEALFKRKKEHDEQADAERRRAAKRALGFEAVRITIQDAINRRDCQAASGSLDRAKQEFSDEQVFKVVLDSFSEQLHSAALEEIRRSVQECFAAGDLDEAARRLSAARSDFSQHPTWQDLNGELSRRNTYAERLANAERLLAAGKRDAARRVLAEANADAPPDSRAADMLLEITPQAHVRTRWAPQWVVWLGVSGAMVSGIILVGLYLKSPSTPESSTNQNATAKTEASVQLPPPSPPPTSPQPQRPDPATAPNLGKQGGASQRDSRKGDRPTDAPTTRTVDVPKPNREPQPAPAPRRQDEPPKADQTKQVEDLIAAERRRREAYSDIDTGDIECDVDDSGRLLDAGEQACTRALVKRQASWYRSPDYC